MDDPVIVIVVTVALIAASAFFVAVEFALIAARRYRLEDAAATSRSARAALRSASELSVLLAGSQLGITVCTLALGAVTKPAVHHWLTPLISSWGAPLWIADVAGFVLALVVVTFLHLVVGEMAPKSWAIAHPEKSATLLALPMRVFMWFTRPLIVTLNRLANVCLRWVGVDPVDQVSGGQDPESLKHLIAHSASVGALDERYQGHLTSALELDASTVGDIAAPGQDLASVGIDDDPEQIRRAARESGHLRLPVRGRDGAIVGVVHTRDAVTAPDGTTAADLARPTLTIDAATPAFDALRSMRDARAHLALVERDGRVEGIVTITDLADRLLPAV